MTTKKQKNINIQTEIEEVSIKGITTPKWLSPVGQYHYRKILKSLKDSGIYNPLDDGLIDMAAMLYGDARDKNNSLKDRRESIKLYAHVIKVLGNKGGQKEPAERDPESDLEDFVRS